MIAAAVAAGCGHGQCQPARVASGGHRADERPAGGYAVHADAITEYCAASQRRGRIDGQHRGLASQLRLLQESCASWASCLGRDAFFLWDLCHLGDKASYQGRLAGAGGTGDADDGSRAVGAGVDQLRDLIGWLAALLHQAEQPAERSPLAPDGTLQQLAGIDHQPVCLLVGQAVAGRAVVGRAVDERATDRLGDLNR